MNKSDETFLTNLIAYAIGAGMMSVIVVAMVPFAMLQAWVISVIWGWFLVPLGLPVLGVARIMGVTVIVGLLKGERYVKDERTIKEKVMAGFFLCVCSPVFALGIAWCVKHFGGI